MIYALTFVLLACGCEEVTIIPEDVDTPDNQENVDDPNTDDSADEDTSGGSADDDTSGGSSDDDTTQRPEPNTEIERWAGEWAQDKASDVVGGSADFYYELNTFDTRVEVVFNDDSASVVCSAESVVSHIDGAYVTLDLTKLSGVEVIVSGTTTNGGIKIYSDSKYKLFLNGVDITSQRGPAINSQSKKRVFVDLAEGTTNRLKDCAVYAEDSYTMPGVYNEDRKGALFAEGNIIMSGYGALVVEGEYKHAVVTDGCYYQRPGVTVAITKTARNGIHAKGDSDDGTGIVIDGGVVVAELSSTAGKGLKCDGDIVINGGVLNISTSGDATYDSEENDTSAAAAIKSNGNTYICAGVLNLSSSGSGGKGISTDGNLEISGGVINISTSGGQYRYSNSLTSSPKGIRADGNITISGGKLNISVTGASEGSEGLESKGELVFNGGETIIKAYDDAINAAKAIVVNDGRVYAQATNNDGIDSNGTLTLNGGLFIGIGSREPEGGIDVDNSTSFVINGGTSIALGGSMMGTPSTISKQYSVVYGGVAASVGTNIAVIDSSNEVLFTFEVPSSYNNSTLFFTTPDITNGSTYTIVSGGTLADYTDYWQGYCSGGTYSGGTTLTTFTPSSVVTTIGNVGGGPGGPGGGGNWPGGRP